MQIIETIHYGDLHSVKSLEIGDRLPVREDVSQALAASPFNSHRADDDAVVSRLLAGLRLRGKAEHGWARYTLTSSK